MTVQRSRSASPGRLSLQFGAMVPSPTNFKRPASISGLASLWVPFEEPQPKEDARLSRSETFSKDKPTKFGFPLSPTDTGEEERRTSGSLSPQDESWLHSVINSSFGEDAHSGSRLSPATPAPRRHSPPRPSVRPPTPPPRRKRVTFRSSPRRAEPARSGGDSLSPTLELR